MNGRPFNINSGNNGASAYIDSTLSAKCSQVVNDLQKFSQYLSQLTPNNAVTVPTGQPAPLTFTVNSVNQDGLAIFNLACNDALNNNNVQQIQINNNANAKIVVINLSGQTCSFQQGNMVGSWLTGSDGQSRTIWNVYEQPANSNTVMSIQRSVMGTLLAPYYTVQTSNTINGAVAVNSFIGGGQLTKPALAFPPCVEPQTTPTTTLLTTATLSSASPLTSATTTPLTTPTYSSLSSTTTNTTGTTTPTTVSTTVAPTATVTVCIIYSRFRNVSFLF